MQETVSKESQESFNCYPVLYRGNESKLLPSYNPIQEVSQLLSFLSEEDTSTTYQKAADKTWSLLKKAILLFLFLVKISIALTIWLCGIGFRSGFSFQKWLDKEQPTFEEIISLLMHIVQWPFIQAFRWASGFIWNLKWENPATSTPTSTSASTSALTTSTKS